MHRDDDNYKMKNMEGRTHFRMEVTKGLPFEASPRSRAMFFRSAPFRYLIWLASIDPVLALGR